MRKLIYPDNLKPQIKQLMKAFHLAPEFTNRYYSTLQISPDEKYLIATNESIVKFWDLKSGQLLRLLQGNSKGDKVESIAISPDGHYLVAGGSNVVSIWDLKDWKIVLEQKRSTEGHYVFSADNSFLADQVWSDRIRLSELVTGKELKIFNHAKYLAFGTDGKSILLAVNEDGQNYVHFLHPTSYEKIKVLRLPAGYVQGFASQGGNDCILISNFDSFTLHIYNLNDGKKILEWKDEDLSNHPVSVSRDGKYIFYAGRNFKVVDILAGRIIKEIPDLHFYSNVHSLSTNNYLLGQAQDPENPNGSRSIVLDFRTWNVSWISPLKDQEIDNILVNPCNDLLYIQSKQEIYTVNVNTGEILSDFSSFGKSLRSVAISNDGQSLFLCTNAPGVDFWSDGFFILEFSTGRVLQTIFPSHQHLKAARFSPNGKFLFEKGENAFWMREVATGNILYEKGMKYYYYNWAFLSDEKRMILFHEKKELSGIYDVETGNLLCNIPLDLHKSYFEITKDNAKMAVKDHNKVQIFDLKEGKMVREFPAHDLPIFCMAFSLDGQYLATGSLDCTLKVWDTLSTNFWGPFHHHTPVTSLAFLSKASLLVSGDQNGDLFIWNFLA